MPINKKITFPEVQTAIADISVAQSDIDTIQTDITALETLTTKLTTFASTTAATYTALATTSGVIVGNLGAELACEITLPSVSAMSGRTYFVKDGHGQATTKNITISTPGAETIDGANTYVISADKAGVVLASDGTNWYVVALK